MDVRGFRLIHSNMNEDFPFCIIKIQVQDENVHPPIFFLCHECIVANRFRKIRSKTVSPVIAERGEIDEIRVAMSGKVKVPKVQRFDGNRFVRSMSRLLLKGGPGYRFREANRGEFVPCV